MEVEESYVQISDFEKCVSLNEYTGLRRLRDVLSLANSPAYSPFRSGPRKTHRHVHGVLGAKELWASIKVKKQAGFPRPSLSLSGAGTGPSALTSVPVCSAAKRLPPESVARGLTQHSAPHG